MRAIRERDQSQAERQGADGKAEAMEMERDVYRAMLCDVIASAHPYPKEHPTMTKQWARARELLKNGPPVGQAWAERDAALKERDAQREENTRLMGLLGDAMRDREAAREAAQRPIAHVDNLGAFADDSDPRVMAVAGPLGEAQCDLYAALGLNLDAEAKRQREDIESRCAVCGRTLAATVAEGCVRGNCSLRPRPANLYAPERAAREWEAATSGAAKETH